MPCSGSPGSGARPGQGRATAVRPEGNILDKRVNAKSVVGAPDGRQASPGAARSAVAPLSPRKQAVGLELMRGESISHIAEMLHCDHSTVGRLIAGIRRQWHAQNLQGWVRR